MRLLILGGTSEAKKLATGLHKALESSGIEVIYSVAGLVRLPQFDCQVISGGFSQFGGLKNYIKNNAVAAILDVTHPFAEKMSMTAAQVAKQCNIAYWAYERPQWQEVTGDDWHLFKTWPELLERLQDKTSLMLTAGQMQQEQLDGLAENSGQTQLLRTAVKPQAQLAKSVTWLKAIGPFDLADEIALMQQYKVDVLVSKMSGGTATEAKITAARQLGLPVYYLTRPATAKADKKFTDIEQCQRFVTEQFLR